MSGPATGRGEGGKLANSTTSAPDGGDFLGAGETAELIRRFDWAATSLGPIETWPQSLKTAASLLLRTPVPMVMLWGEHGYMIYNDAYSVFAGGRHPEVLGAKVREGWPEVADFNDHVMKVGLAGGVLSFRDQELTLHRTGKPEQVWMNLDYSPVLDETGKPAGVIAVVVETTERVRADAAVRESESRFRNMADDSPVMMWVTGPTGWCTYLNRQWYEYTGQSEGESEGYGWLEATHPDDKPRAQAAFLAANAAQAAYRVEFRLRRADGVYRWVIDAASPRFDANGQYLGYVGSVIDIDERREMEEALRDSERRYRQLFNSLDAGFCVVEVMFDGDGRCSDYRFIEMNPAFSAQTGLQDAIGRTARELVPGLEQHWFDLYGEVARTGEPARFEEGSVPMGRWFDVHAFRVGPPEAGRVAILFNDISKRRKAEEDLKRLNETLEQQVAAEVSERIRAEEALRQSQKLEAMGQLTGGVAHDFNNLLTPIIGSLDMIQRRGLGSEREQRLVEGGLQSAERAKILVQRLLAFARRQPLQLQPVDVAGVVRGMAELIGSTSGPRIRLELEIADGLPRATAEANQLEMAILNLAVNARDAMPDGGTLTIAVDDAPPPARLGLPAGPYVRVGVSDTGVGMSEEVIRRAIEPFFSTKGVGQGTGLGLSMAHGLASQLGGALDIASMPGLGTTVALWLPANAGAARDAAPAAEAPAPGEGAGVALLVDDEDLVRASTAAMLADLGYRVIEAGSGEAALARLGRERVDLLVTDHLMPGMTGADLAWAALRERPALPVLIISGYADAEDIAPELSRLTKPFRRDELAAALAAARKGRGEEG